MERDFLGINAKPNLESPPPRDDGRGSNPNSATYGNATLQWSFTNREQPQHFLPFATRQEGQSSQFSPPGFHPSQRAHVLDSSQLHQSQSTSHYVSETRVPNVNQRLFGSAPSSLSPRTNPFVGLYQARDLSKPFPAQLTIFYQGSVSVFDNIPLDKAREIMSLASKASSTAATPNPILEQPTKPLSKSASFSGGVVISPKPKPTQEPLLPPPPVSTQISLTIQASAGPSSMSAVTNESLTTGPHSDAPVTPAPMVSIAAPTVPRAIPQARKASLARFLEKRKERVTAAMPYPSTPKSSEDLTGKSSSTELTLSSNNDESLRACPPKTKNYSEEYFSSKLEI